MLPKIHALPSPSTAANWLDGANLDELLTKHDQMNLELSALHKSIEALAVTHCGAGEAEDVELYDGTLGVSRKFVDDHEAPVGQLQWLEDLDQRFDGPNESPGTVKGIRWATGSMISDRLFLTAGHAFDSEGDSWVRPSRNRVPIEPSEIATLMQVNFNYQLDGQTGQKRHQQSFPVKRLLEYRNQHVDYAIVELGPNANGEFPGDANLFGTLNIAAADLRMPGSTLCIIQHPNQGLKKIDAGKLLENSGGFLFYNDIDVVGGASGSPVLSKDGEIVGIHVAGGCMTIGGANRGRAIGAIRRASSLI